MSDSAEQAWEATTETEAQPRKPHVHKVIEAHLPLTGDDQQHGNTTH